MNPPDTASSPQPEKGPTVSGGRSHGDTGDTGDPAISGLAVGSDQADPAPGRVEKVWPDDAEGGEDDEYIPL